MKSNSTFYIDLIIWFVLLLSITPRVCLSEWSFTATGTTNYIYRSYTKSDNKPAARFNIDFEHSIGVFSGVTFSNVDFADKGFQNRSYWELTPYVGFSFPLNDSFRLETQWLRYIYDNHVFGRDADYNEFYFFLHYDDLISARVSFSEDFWNQNAAATDVGLTFRYSMIDTLQFSSGVGYSFYESALEYDYAYWNAGLTYFTKYAAFDLRYADSKQVSVHSSDYHYHDNQLELMPIDTTVVFSVSIGF